ncbi:hypothetical protein FRB99_007623 [Tulasnella sp. 403]|nr:hypothetical protein FRB99_007623 [Tulasnella sp. 403]
MSRFASTTSPTDAWNHHMQERVVLPPLSTVDNGLTPARRTSAVSPATYTPQGSYAFTNTFESQRPPTASSGVASPSLSTVRMDMSTGQETHTHGPHPYRRPSLAGRSQSGVVNRNPPTSPLVQEVPRMTATYNDPNSLSWNIPPPSAGATIPENGRPSTAAYSTYGDYATTDFTGTMATNGEGTPQSPSFAFASTGFSNPQGMYAMNGHPRSATQHPGFTLAQAAAIASQPTPPPSNASSTTLMDSSPPNHPQAPIEEELAQLRTKVRELEFVNDLVQLRVVELENEKQKLLSERNGQGPKSVGALSPPEPEFQSSWDKRTEARIKRFCSLNRAGNALCAWHDSRRERRAYPPRMAPPGTLNCGCTYEEALFEESLSRHKVGSYLPGEMVRMDPALRNPLLALLQWRYGYKDGDFERDPASGKWVDGEGEHVWQQKAASGSTSSSRRKQSDPDTT